ncbi:MAG: hypothetical protein FJ010_12165 [Chloroflexi bacterium]|nr:hypothetical protein [Chloroflexota bacterium]
MEPVEVTVRFDPQGKMIPLSFVWQRRTYRVESIGRQWEGKDGHHILVMTPENRAHHLLFVSAKGIWHRVKGSDTPTLSMV